MGRLFCFRGSGNINVLRTKVDLALEWQREVVSKLFELLCFVLLGAAPIRYVQAGILNLPHL